MCVYNVCIVILTRDTISIIGRWFSRQLHEAAFKPFSCVLKCLIWATFELLITFKRSHRGPNEVSILACGRSAEYWQESSL